MQLGGVHGLEAVPGQLVAVRGERGDARLSERAGCQEEVQAVGAALPQERASQPSPALAQDRANPQIPADLEHALEELSRKGLVQLDEERKAAMVSNLLVVLCSESSATPVASR